MYGSSYYPLMITVRFLLCMSPSLERKDEDLWTDMGCMYGSSSSK